MVFRLKWLRAELRQTRIEEEEHSDDDGGTMATAI